MNSENVMWMFFWTILGIVLISLFYFIYQYNVNENERIAQANKECIEAGGNYIPLKYSDYMCLIDKVKK
jgi:Pyruvate/2-oxoacid:ferredoxin oxidoreductase gamma subunit